MLLDRQAVGWKDKDIVPAHPCFDLDVEFAVGKALDGFARVASNPSACSDARRERHVGRACDHLSASWLDIG